MEVITILGSTVTIIVAMASGFGWLVTRMDARFAASDARMNERFAMVEERFSGMDARFGALEERLSGIEHEVTEVRIAVARLEGPPRRLISVR
ncbi:response regulator [Microbacterium sufflavum]